MDIKKIVFAIASIATFGMLGSYFWFDTVYDKSYHFSCLYSDKYQVFGAMLPCDRTYNSSLFLFSLLVFIVSAGYLGYEYFKEKTKESVSVES